MIAFPIHPLLSHYVRSIVVQDNSGHGAAVGAPYRVLPKPYPVIGFQYRGRLRVHRGNRDALLARAGITGLQREARWFVGAADTRSVLVALQPASAWALFGVPLDELADAHVALSDLLPEHEVREVEERIATGDAASTISARVQRFLLRALKRSGKTTHPAVTAAAMHLLEQRGNLRIEALAAELGVGRRQLERLFRLQVGVSPREFAGLARFTWATERIVAGQSSADVAAQAGYADQAHLIRTFAKRTGQTPGRFTPDDVADVAFVQSPADPIP
jgi:AraC-like DNA-binding protein